MQWHFICDFAGLSLPVPNNLLLVDTSINVEAVLSKIWAPSEQNMTTTCSKINNVPPLTVYLIMCTFRNRQAILDKYCIRGAEWGVGDCSAEAMSPQERDNFISMLKKKAGIEEWRKEQRPCSSIKSVRGFIIRYINLPGTVPFLGSDVVLMAKKHFLDS